MLKKILAIINVKQYLVLNKNLLLKIVLSSFVCLAAYDYVKQYFMVDNIQCLLNVIARRCVKQNWMSSKMLCLSRY